ncbi:MAG: hypothetical protein GX217_07250 [Clostridiaceae bacterium]|nr:hypothetical protein [Clostridiaceae bacterium]
MKKIIAITLILIISLGLVACGGGGKDKDSIVGKWALEVSEADMEGKWIYEFAADGKLKISIETGSKEADELMNAMFSEMEITYEAKDGKLTLKSDDPTFEPLNGVSYTIKDDTLTFEENSMKRIK